LLAYIIKYNAAIIVVSLIVCNRFTLLVNNLQIVLHIGWTTNQTNY